MVLRTGAAGTLRRLLAPTGAACLATERGTSLISVADPMAAVGRGSCWLTVRSPLHVACSTRPPDRPQQRRHADALHRRRRRDGKYMYAAGGTIRYGSTGDALRCWSCGEPGHNAAECTAPVTKVHDPRNATGVRPLHRPVMLQETLRFLQPAPGRRLLDATFGAGGHTSEMLRVGATVVAADRDPHAIGLALGMQAQWPEGQLICIHARFGKLMEVLVSTAGNPCEYIPPQSQEKLPRSPLSPHHQQLRQQQQMFDGILLDLGMSSLQLDDAGRGFAFSRDGPLDMRMEGRGPSAADIVALAGRPQLADILRNVRAG